MSNSMKDALIKAGVISKDTIEREKEKERRDKIQKKGPSQAGIHAHHMRTDCAQCGKGAPDVEYYEHTNRSVDAKWLCIPCADKLWIKDECRVTNQSVYAKTGKFRREFGATKVFPKETPAAKQGPAPAQAAKQPQQPQQHQQPKQAANPASQADQAARMKPGYRPAFKPKGSFKK